MRPAYSAIFVESSDNRTGTVGLVQEICMEESSSSDVATKIVVALLAASKHKIELSERLTRFETASKNRVHSERSARILQKLPKSQRQ